MTPDPNFSDMIYLNITFHKPAATGHRLTRQMRRDSYKPGRKRLCSDSKTPGRSENESRTWCLREPPRPDFRTKAG